MDCSRRAWLMGGAATVLGLARARRAEARGKPEVTVYKDPT